MTVNSKEENFLVFCPNYVQEFGLRQKKNFGRQLKNLRIKFYLWKQIVKTLVQHNQAQAQFHTNFYPVFYTYTHVLKMTKYGYD